MATNRNLNVGERVSKRQKAISEQIDAEKVRVGEDFRSRRVLKFERTGYPSLAA